MNRRRLVEVLLGAVGLVGVAASIYGIEEPLARAVLGSLAGVLSCAVAIVALQDLIGLSRAWSTLRCTRKLGIRRLHLSVPDQSRLSREIASSKLIRIMAVSAHALVYKLKTELVEALRERNAEIRLLVAEPSSRFVRDVEESESPSREGNIAGEIVHVQDLLAEYVAQARKSDDYERKVGTVRVGFYSTHLRCSVVLCDERWGWLTLNLPPKRAIQTTSLEIVPCESGLFTDVSTHFERTWKLMADRGAVREVSAATGA